MYNFMFLWKPNTVIWINHVFLQTIAIFAWTYVHQFIKVWLSKVKFNFWWSWKIKLVPLVLYSSSNHSPLLLVTYELCRPAHHHLPLSVSLSAPLLLSLPLFLFALALVLSVPSALTSYWQLFSQPLTAVLTDHTKAPLDHKTTAPDSRLGHLLSWGYFSGVGSKYLS